MAILEDVTALAGSEQGLCVVATVRVDGSVHSSVINAGPMAHPISGDQVFAFVARGAARKVGLIGAAGRASLTYRRSWQWAGVEGRAEVLAPTDVPAGIDGPTMLRAIFVAAGGDHDDWGEFDRVMAEEGRVAVFVHPDRIIGNG